MNFIDPSIFKDAGGIALGNHTHLTLSYQYVALYLPVLIVSKIHSKYRRHFGHQNSCLLSLSTVCSFAF